MPPNTGLQRVLMEMDSIGQALEQEPAINIQTECAVEGRIAVTDRTTKDRHTVYTDYVCNQDIGGHNTIHLIDICTR